MTEPTSAQDLFRGRHFDQEIIILCIRWYLTFKLSSRDLVQMVLVQISKKVGGTGKNLGVLTEIRFDGSLARKPNQDEICAGTS